MADRPPGRSGGGRQSRSRGGARREPREPPPTSDAPTPPASPESGAQRPVERRPDREPEREPEREPGEHRVFDMAGEPWTAWIAGKGAWGSGAYGLGMVVAVHFAPAHAPDRPVREVLLARGRFAGLYDEELCELFERATPIAHEPPRQEQPRRERRNRDW